MAKNVDVIACCQGLNVNQRLSIGAALNKLRLDEKLASVSFWGKIQGKERDYFIAQSIKTGTKIEKNRFFSQDNGVTFAKLPELDAFIIETAPRHRGRFSGNPSLRLREPKVGGGESEEDFEEEEEEDYDENDGEDRKVADRKLTEVERLAFVVDQIETACCVVPKGSWFITATGDIKENVAFTGLSFDDAKKLDNFVLFRPPQKERTLAKVRCLMSHARVDNAPARRAQLRSEKSICNYGREQHRMPLSVVGLTVD